MRGLHGDRLSYVHQGRFDWIGGVIVGIPFVGLGGFLAGLILVKGFPSLWNRPPANFGELLLTIVVFTWGVLQGTFFLCVGVWFLVGRSGTILDRAKRTITTWWGLVVPFRKSVHDLRQFENISIHYWRGSKGRSHYELLLNGSNGRVLEIHDLHTKEDAQRVAMEVAAFTGLAFPARMGGTHEPQH